MLAMALPAVEGTIVSTAMPSIVAQLGGFDLYAWVFSAFLLTQALATPLFGSLADRHGRRPVLVWGIASFLAGSLLCGFATSMPLLIAFRFLQGLGAGAIYPTVSTLASDLYEVRERGRAQAFIASVWGVSALLGPVLGGTLVQGAHWGWVFWFNVPLGVIAILGLRAFVGEEVGAAAVDGGVRNAPRPPARSALSLIGLLGLDLWRDPLILLANLATFMAGMMMIGLTAYTPTYVQGVMGYSPIVAGFALTTMSLGWPLAGFVAGRLIVPLGPGWTARIGGSVVLLGGLLYLLLTPERGPWWVAGSSFTVGVGMGFVMTTMIVAIQSSVAWSRRGVATATNMLMRLLGNSLGAVALGMVLNLSLRRSVRALAAGDPALGAGAFERIERMLTPGGTGFDVDIGPAALGQLTHALGSGLHGVYLVVCLAGVLVFLASWLVPVRRRLGS